MNRQQFFSVTEWQKETFPNATTLSKLHHLQQEVKELMEAVSNEDHTIDHEAIRKTKMEFADCFTLLFGAACAYGMSYDDICKAIFDKMEINKKRKWGKPDANGVVNHVKE